MKILVLGLGVSGKAVVEFLLQEGHDVVGCDRSITDKGFHCPVFTEIDFPKSMHFDQVVVSPGISPENPIYSWAKEVGIEVIGEAEFAFRRLKNPIIAVTGTNGKSTTVSIIAHVFRKSGRKVVLLGNIGTPIVSVVGKVDITTILVVELSSYQLETISTRCIDVGALMNLTTNHLDRHKTMENYLATKLRLASAIKDGGTFFIGEDVVRCYPEICKGVYYTAIGGKFLSPPDHLAVDAVNLTFAFEICKKFGITEGEFREAIESFQRLKHRLQFVGEVNGVKCYNDSKGTTVQAVLHALRSLGGNIVLLLGGPYKKGEDFTLLLQENGCNLRKVLIFGEAREIIAKQIGNFVPWVCVETMQEALQKGLNEALKGDRLLLSPGCASFDQFRNFEERGDAFIRGVENESKRYDLNSCSH